MAEVAGPLQFLGRITGANQQLGAGATYPHPLAGTESLTRRWVGRIHIRAAETNTANINITNKTGAGNSVKSLLPGESYEFVVYNPGERLRLGQVWINTTGSDYAEVFYTLR